MFYTEEMSEALRFGDVLRGYFSTTPVIEEPILGKSVEKYNIDVDFPPFSVVMDPCCEIGRETISLTPLIPIRSSFFNNPYLVEDFTRVNRKMNPEQAIPPSAWARMEEVERQERRAIGLAYAFVGLFVYEAHDLLPRYIIHRREGNVETNYYMINFRDTNKLCCGKIHTPEDAPLESKVLELTPETRNELRDKLASYYGTVPREDRILED